MSLLRILTAFLCATLAVLLPAAEVLLVNVDEAHPPFMSGRDGKAVGIYPALLEAAFNHMNIMVRLEPKPWARAIREIDAATAGLAGVYKNAERLKKWDYSDPLMIERIVVYHHLARPVTFTTLEDLKGKRVGVMRGWSYGDAFDAARLAGLFQAEDVSSDDQNFRKLESGRIDVAMAIPESVATLLTQYTFIRSSETPLTAAPAFLAFSKDSNQGPLIEHFNQTIKEMKASGEFRTITLTESTR